MNESKPGIIKAVVAGFVALVTRGYGWFSDRVGDMEKRLEEGLRVLVLRLDATERNLRDTDGRVYQLSQEIAEIKGRLDERSHR